MKKIDVHCHYYPEKYLKELARFGVDDTVGVPLSKVKWDSVETRVKDQDENGIDMELLGVSSPNVYFEDKEFSLSLSQLTNDELVEIRRAHPDRFGCLASVPLVDMKYALDELDRSVGKLGMDGVVVGTNINGRPLESEEFLPFFEEVNRKKIPIFLHPMHPRGSDFMKDYQTLSIVGFVFETTLTVTKMVLSGLFERYPDIRMVLPHLGGTIPFLHGRIDLGFQTYEAARKGLEGKGKLPSDYFKRLYWDTTTSYPSALRCTYELVGADQILFGSDYPYTKGFRMPLSVEVIESAHLTEEEKAKIFFKNITKLIPRLANV